MCLKKQHFHSVVLIKEMESCYCWLVKQPLHLFCPSFASLYQWKTNDLWPDFVWVIPKSTEVIWDSMEKRNFFLLLCMHRFLLIPLRQSCQSLHTSLAFFLSSSDWWGLAEGHWTMFCLSGSAHLSITSVPTEQKKWILITTHLATKHPVLLSISLKHLQAKYVQNAKLEDFINQRFRHRIKRETSDYSTFVTVSIRLPATKKTQHFSPICA